MKRVEQIFTALAIAACLVSAASAQSKAADVTGKWRMNVKFDQQVAPATLIVTLKGEQVTGTLDAGFAGGSIPIEGEFSQGTLTFSGSTTSGPHPGMQLDFTATLADDKLAGTFSWQVGDFAWTAERVR